MGSALEPFRQHLESLTTIPGISDVAAHVIAGEVGLDVVRFPTASHLISWAGLCPRLDESAGKHRSRRIRKGAPWLKTTLVSAAWAAVTTKGTYLQAQFQRLRARRGAKNAIIAVAASMLTAAYHILRDAVPTRTLGPSTSRVATRSTPRVACSNGSKTSDSPSRSAQRPLGFLSRSTRATPASASNSLPPARAAVIRRVQRARPAARSAPPAATALSPNSTCLRGAQCPVRCARGTDLYSGRVDPHAPLRTAECTNGYTCTRDCARALANPACDLGTAAALGE